MKPNLLDRTQLQGLRHSFQLLATESTRLVEKVCLDNELAIESTQWLNVECVKAAMLETRAGPSHTT